MSKGAPENDQKEMPSGGKHMEKTNSYMKTGRTSYKGKPSQTKKKAGKFG